MAFKENMVGRADRQHQDAQASQRKTSHRKIAGLVALLMGITGLAVAQTAQEVRELLEWGDNDMALERAASGIEKNPEDAELKFYHALALARTGKTDDALNEFRDLAEQYPDHPEIHNNMAVLYALEGDYEQARAALEAALGTNEVYATAHKNLGDIYSAQAADAYNRALARDEQRETPKPELNLLSQWSPDASASKPASSTPVEKKPTAKEPVEVKPAAPAKPVKKISTAKVEKPVEPDPKPKSEPIPEPAPEPAAIQEAEPAKAAKPKPAAPVVVAKTEAEKTPDPKTKPVKKISTAPAEATGTGEKVKEQSNNRPAVNKVESKPVAAKPVPEKTEKVIPPAKEKAAPPLPVIAPAQAKMAAQAVENWAAAWRAKNANGYINAYASFFRPESGLSHAEWAKQRRARVTAPKYIRVTLRNLRIRLKGEGRAIANFQQDYQSDSYQDSVKKVLYLENIKGSWKIVREVAE